MESGPDPASSASESTLLGDTAVFVSRSQDGDPRAREKLFGLYRPRLERFLRARVPRQNRALLETQDLVQEVCLRASNHLENFEYRGIGSFWAYLRKISLSVLVSTWRSGQRAAPTTPLQEGQDQVDEAVRVPLEEIVREEDFKAFESALASVPDRQREALLMRLELGMDYETIAAECRFDSADAARMAIKRAIQRIAKEMSRGG